MTQHNCELNEELKCQDKDIKEPYLAKMYVLYGTGGINLRGESIHSFWRSQWIILKLKQRIIFLDICEPITSLSFPYSGKALTDWIYNTLLMLADAVHDVHLPLLQGKLQALLLQKQAIQVWGLHHVMFWLSFFFLINTENR